MKNFYNTLGVSEDASSNEIKKAFKEIAKKEHPDRGGNEKVFKDANEAYDTLKDTRIRLEYKEEIIILLQVALVKICLRISFQGLDLIHLEEQELLEPDNVPTNQLMLECLYQLKKL